MRLIFKPARQIGKTARLLQEQQDHINLLMRALAPFAKFPEPYWGIFFTETETLSPEDFALAKKTYEKTQEE